MAASYDRCAGTENRVSSSEAAPENPIPGDLWYDLMNLAWKRYEDSETGWVVTPEVDAASVAVDTTNFVTLTGATVQAVLEEIDTLLSP